MSDFGSFNNLRVGKHDSLVVSLGLVEIKTKDLTFFKNFASLTGEFSNLLAK